MSSDLWKELHSHILNDYVDKTNDIVWLSTWTKKIPRFTKGCSCNEHWTKWYRANPPNFTSREAYFAWSVKAHNDVNLRLNKPSITVEQAKAMYAKK